jgi:hypothetical protein
MVHAGGTDMAKIALLLLAGLGIALESAGGAVAQEPPKEKTFEQNLEIGLVTVINEGATIYNNQGDWAGCYRLYEGALRAIQPILGKYPELQKSITAALAEANLLARMPDRAHLLRKALQETRFALNPALRPQPVGKMPGEPPQDKKKDDSKGTEDKSKDDKKGDAKATDDKKGQPLPDPKLATVKGTVKLDGKPLGEGYVTFISADGRRYSANILKNGTFWFSKGFVPGTYKIAVEADPPGSGSGAEPVAIPPAYSIERSSLVLNAIRGENVTDLALQTKDP